MAILTEQGKIYPNSNSTAEGLGLYLIKDLFKFQKTEHQGVRPPKKNCWAVEVDDVERTKTVLPGAGR